MIILNRDFTDTYTNETGVGLYFELKKYIEKKELILVSFKDVTTSTSFLNSSFGEIIENYGLDCLKSFVKPIDVSKGQSKILKDYINSMSKRIIA